MFNFEFLKQLLMIAIPLSSITCAFIQKTKFLFKKSKYIGIYSLVVNIVIGIVFCQTFTKVSLPTSIWIGVFSFIGADSIYKTLEGKISSFSDIVSNKTVQIPQENIINKEEK